MHCGLTTSYCLTDCQSCPSAEDHNCFHFEDVTLDCRKYEKFTTYFDGTYNLYFRDFIFVY